MEYDLYELYRLAEKRVAAGATWLDENRPTWLDAIDLDTLMLQSPLSCVLGQVYNREANPSLWVGGFSYALSRYFDSDHRKAADKGFCCDEEAGIQFPHLQVAWEAEITRRREGV